MVAASPSPPPKLQGENEPHAAWLLRRIWDRVNTQNEHFMGVIVGREGSGKSHTAMRIASEVDRSFTHERVIFDVAELLQRLKDGDHETGNFYVLDEAGVQLGRRTWQERSQVLANQALQLIRDHNLGLLFTLPRLGEFDSQAQGRLQAAYEILDKEDGEYVRGKWKWFDPDRMDETGTIYKKLPRRRQGGELKKIKTMAFAPPEPDLYEPYEERKRAFQEGFYEEVLDALEDKEAEEAEDKQTVKDIAAEVNGDGIQQFISRDGRDGSPYLNKDLIRAEHEVSHADARTVKALLEEQYDESDLEDLL